MPTRESIAAVARAILVAALLLAPRAADAFHFDLRVSPSSGGMQGEFAWLVTPGELAIVDVYVDAEPGLQIFAVGVSLDDNGVLTYDPGASSMPSYVLYTPGAGTSAASWMAPHTDPPAFWPGTNAPGKQQIHVEFESAPLGFAPIAGSGNGIWIGTLVFQVEDVLHGSFAQMDLVLDGAQGAAVIAYDNDVTSSATASGSFWFSVPEPEAPLLVGAGLAVLAALARRGPAGQRRPIVRSQLVSTRRRCATRRSAATDATSDTA